MTWSYWWRNWSVAITFDDWTNWAKGNNTKQNKTEKTEVSWLMITVLDPMEIVFTFKLSR